MFISILLNRKIININILVEWPQTSTSFIVERKWTGAFGEPCCLEPLLQHSHPRIILIRNIDSALSHSPIVVYIPSVMRHQLWRGCSLCSLKQKHWLWLKLSRRYAKDGTLTGIFQQTFAFKCCTGNKPEKDCSQRDASLWRYAW